jgi:hypothetical protein
MPKKAKTVAQLFQIIGGTTYTPASVNFSQEKASEVSLNQPSVNAGFINVMPPPNILATFLTTLNANPYLLAVAYLFLNLSGRFLTLELTKQQESFLAHKAIRPIILFCVMFVATRNLAAAFWSTLLFLSVIWIFANENHILCLIPGWRAHDEKSQDKEKVYENNMKVLQNKTDK